MKIISFESSKEWIGFLLLVVFMAWANHKDLVLLWRAPQP
jgi:hypothetical protein